MRIPNHIGVIPDGNRRWAEEQGMTKEKGYDFGLKPGMELFKLCQAAGVNEITYYGFTEDNTKRPVIQTQAFVKSCVDAVEMLSHQDASILVVGNTNSRVFPKELLPYTSSRQIFGKGGLKINFLVNYSWEWDLNNMGRNMASKKQLQGFLKTRDISRIDLIIRWGGRRRLSGFLPVQSVYADFYVLDSYWPDFKAAHFQQALDWYNQQDVTLGG